MKVLVVDDHSLIRVYLKHFLEEHFPDFEVYVLQKIEINLPEQIISINPELLIIDISLDLLDTLDFFKHLKYKLPETLFIIYTMHNINSYKKFFLEQGAHAYVLKEDAGSKLEDVIQSVLDGQKVFPEDLNENIDRYQLNQLNFSETEKNLLSNMLETLNTEALAKKLAMSTNEVLNLKLALLKKTGAVNTQELLLFTVEYNWIR